MVRFKMRWCKCLSCPKSEVEDVTTLDFSCSALTEVPPIVFNFERTLENLHLDYNKITELPRTLFQCEELRYLGLSDNEIETLPPLVDKLTNLESLLLSRNCLGFESIPSNLHRCQKLKILHLSSNSLTKVPSPITRLVALKELYLNNCDLEFLPANFGRLHNLRILELRENHLATLPKSLKRLSDLRRLDISSNMLKKFPEVIGTMVNLTELWLNDNFISEVPDCIGSLHKLSHFDISCNRLEKVTNNIGLCSCMTLLLLSMNDLKELPRAIANLPLLHTLKADHNLLETLPLNIGKLSNLEELDVQFNNLKSFPNSIGMLRKLSSLVASQNSISFLPTEIGSCTSLSVVSLHYNVLMYLPEEIGHLQKLTSISLINNRLRYLPITILSLQKLKALWLSHNQSQPLITLQKDVLESGQVVLTCVFLPQMEMPLQIPTTPEVVVPSGRKIGFMEPNLSSDLPAKLNRIPTPHPKAFVKYQRTLENTLRRNQETIPQSISVDAVYVKEASIKPMKNSTDETDAVQVPLMKDVETVEYTHHKRPLELVDDQHQTIYYDSIRKHEQSNDGSEIQSEYIPSVGSVCTTTSLENGMSNLQIDESLYNVSIKSSNSNEKELSYEALQSHMLSIKPKQPPPYHIAAAYSRDAHLFVNSNEKSESELEPKHFTQDQPSNILNPQAKHAHSLTQSDIQNLNQYSGGFENGNYNDNIVINLRILEITTALLRINVHNPTSTNIIDKFIKLSNLIEENEKSCDIITLKLKILKTTESLLCSQDYISLNKNFIMQGLDQLQENLTECSSIIGNYEDTNKNEVEFQERLVLIDIATILLDFDGESYEFWDIFNQVLQIEKVFPQNHQLELTKIVRNRLFLQAKIILLKMVIHFLTAKTIDKDYKYNLSRFMQLQRRLHYNMKDLNLNGLVEENSTNINCSKSGQKQQQNVNWLFGTHRNPKIIKVELTPCCYVLGFSISHNKEGVFVNEVDKNGNAYQKLFTGDRILMLDERDVSKMSPEDALKAVQMWGPETEVFLISRT